MTPRTSMLIKFIEAKGMAAFMTRYNLTAYKVAKSCGLATSTTYQWADGAEPCRGSMLIIAEAIEGGMVNAGYE